MDLRVAQLFVLFADCDLRPLLLCSVVVNIRQLRAGCKRSVPDHLKSGGKGNRRKLAAIREAAAADRAEMLRKRDADDCAASTERAEAKLSERHREADGCQSHAAGKGAVADPCHADRNVIAPALTGGAAKQSFMVFIKQDAGNRAENRVFRENLDHSQLRAIAESRAADRRHALRNHDRFQRCAFTEGLCADLFNAGGKRHALQAAAAVKRVSADALHVSGKRQLCQRSAKRKSICAETGHTLRDHDFRKLTAAGKGRVAYICDAARQSDLGQPITIEKGLCADGGNALGNRHFFDQIDVPGARIIRHRARTFNIQLAVLIERPADIVSLRAAGAGSGDWPVGSGIELQILLAKASQCALIVLIQDPITVG